MADIRRLRRRLAWVCLATANSRHILFTPFFASSGSMWPARVRANIRAMQTSHATMQGPAIYQIRVQGIIPLDWSSRLMGMNITLSREDESTLVGRLPDQAALSGVLSALYDQQYPVLSVECLEVG